jgi:hypothetical protein
MKNFKKISSGLIVDFMSLFLLGASSAQVQSNLVTVKSVKSFDATIAGLKKGVAYADMMVIS